MERACACFTSRWTGAACRRHEPRHPDDKHIELTEVELDALLDGIELEKRRKPPAVIHSSMRYCSVGFSWQRPSGWIRGSWSWSLPRWQQSSSRPGETWKPRRASRISATLQTQTQPERSRLVWWRALSLVERHQLRCAPRTGTAAFPRGRTPAHDKQPLRASAAHHRRRPLELAACHAALAARPLPRTVSARLARYPRPPRPGRARARTRTHHCTTAPVGHGTVVPDGPKADTHRSRPRIYASAITPRKKGARAGRTIRRRPPRRCRRQGRRTLARQGQRARADHQPARGSAASGSSSSVIEINPPLSRNR